MESNIFETIIRLLYEQCGFLCHQLESRCIVIAGVPLPVCSRCSGIYFGAVVSLMVQLIQYNWRQRIYLNKTVCWTTGSAFILLLFDVYAGYRIYGDLHSVRFASGYLFGFMLTLLVWSLYQNYMISKSKLEIIQKKQYLSFAAMIIGLSFLFVFYIFAFTQAWVFYAGTIAIFTGILIIYSLANALLFFWIFDKLRYRCETGRCVFISLLIGTMLFALQMLMIELSGLTI